MVKRRVGFLLILLSSDYMLQFSKIVIPAGIAGIQAPWMGLSLPSMALDTCSRKV